MNPDEELKIRDWYSTFLAQEAWKNDDPFKEIKPMADRALPLLLEFFPTLTKWQARAEVLYYATRFARDCQAAFQLGILGCSDKAAVVRYRACGVLAYSLRLDAISTLEPLLHIKDPKTVADASAAVRAIQHQNHHLFIDRSGSGRSFWVVNEGDRPKQ